MSLWCVLCAFCFHPQDKTTLSILEKLHGLLGIDRNDAEPHSVEARRRLAFFTNSLFMDMPRAPPVQARERRRVRLFSLLCLLACVDSPSPLPSTYTRILFEHLLFVCACFCVFFLSRFMCLVDVVCCPRCLAPPPSLPVCTALCDCYGLFAMGGVGVDKLATIFAHGFPAVQPRQAYCLVVFILMRCPAQASSSTFVCTYSVAKDRRCIQRERPPSQQQRVFYIYVQKQDQIHCFVVACSLCSCTYRLKH